MAARAALAVLGFMQTDWALAQRRLAAWLAPLHAQLAVLPALGAKRLNASVIAGTLLQVILVAVVWMGVPMGRGRTDVSGEGDQRLALGGWECWRDPVWRWRCGGHGGPGDPPGPPAVAGSVILVQPRGSRLHLCIMRDQHGCWSFSVWAKCPGPAG